jgi:4-amino-4-deoxy-L-arabinose transferase-like glycosyltransferase
MSLPYDGWSVAAILTAGACLFGSSRPRAPLTLRIALIAAAGFVLRLDASWQLSLHTWDESVHAVVAKGLAVHPLVPTLYEELVLQPSGYSWTEAHIWLHKPPLSLWFMALALKLLGTSAPALRLPSLVMGTLGIVLTFAVGRRVFNDRVGLLAAAFHAVNGLLIALASGRRVADHVDTALIFFVQLGVLLALESTRRRGRAAVFWTSLAGCSAGLGVLAKSLPALLVAVVAFAIWNRALGLKRAAARTAIVLASAAVVCLPWLEYIHHAFPETPKSADAYTLQHITTVVEDHAGPVWSYVVAMPRFFGELVYLPVGWFLWTSFRRDADAGRVGIAVWLAVPYIVFSFMQTKLTAFVAIAAPAIFLAAAAGCIQLRDAIPAVRTASRQVWLRAVLALLVLLPARYLLEPHSALERRDRSPEDTRQFRELNRLFDSGTAVIFNVARPYELMFYSDLPAYTRMPRPEDVAELHRRGKTIVVYQPKGVSVAVPESWQATLLQGR